MITPGTTITTLRNQLAKGEFSAEELSAYFLERIARYDKDINSYLAVSIDTKDAKVTSGLLSGIPIAFKDNFCTNGIRTTAASRVLETFIPPYDATVVSRMKRAGALILGKTNMDAWAHGSSTETSDFNPSKNPHDTTRVPGGSSGGSAACVSSYLAPGSIGSETAGSIRQPAAWCGVVGLKPTYGRVSRYGVVAMGSSWDCPGPLTLSVEDAALILEVIAGEDRYDATSSNHRVPKYTQGLTSSNTYTIGITDDYFEGVEGEIRSKIESAIDILKRMGHSIKKIKLMHPKYAISVYTLLQRAEVSSNLGRYDGIRYGKERSFFGEEAKRRIMLGTYTLSHGYYDQYYKKAIKVRQCIKDDFTSAFGDCDLIVAPTTPTTALKLGEWERYPFFGETMDVLNEPAAAAGIPAISIPVGVDKAGLPIGMQFMGRWFDEATLLNISHYFEKETDFFGVRENAFKKYVD